MIDAQIIEWLNDEKIQAFIQQNRTEKTHDLALKLSKSKLPREFVLNQINGRRLYQKKAPFLVENPRIIYPPKINIEQSSSFKTAEYKSGLFNGNSMVDLSGGFGIDTYHFSKTFKKVHYVDPNKELLEIVQWNFNQLGIDNVIFHHKTAMQFFATQNAQYDLIYVDPSRRDKSNAKKYRISECNPDLTVIQSHIKKRGIHFMYKLSPVLDIQQSLKDLDHIHKVHVVSIENECKELILCGTVKPSEQIYIRSVHILENAQESDEYNFGDLNNVLAESTMPDTFLYFFNPSIMKSGGQNLLAKKLGLNKIANNSHIFTSDKLIDDFHGRIFKVLKFGDFDAKKLGLVKGDEFRIMLRNSSYSINQIQKKLKIKEGGDLYLIATTSKEKKPLIIIGSALQ